MSFTIEDLREIQSIMVQPVLDFMLKYAELTGKPIPPSEVVTEALTPKITAQRQPKQETPAEPPTPLSDKETLLGIYTRNKSGEIQFASKTHIKQVMSDFVNYLTVLPSFESEHKKTKAVLQSITSTLFTLAHKSLHPDLTNLDLVFNEADLLIASECMRHVTSTPLIEWFYELISQYVSENLTLDGKYDVSTESGFLRVQDVSQDFINAVEDEIVETFPDIDSEVIDKMVWRLTEYTCLVVKTHLESPLEDHSNSQLIIDDLPPDYCWSPQRTQTFDEFMSLLNKDQSYRFPMNLSILSGLVPMFHVRMGTPSRNERRTLAVEPQNYLRYTAHIHSLISGKPVQGRIPQHVSYPDTDPTTLDVAKLFPPIPGGRKQHVALAQFYNDNSAILSSIIWKHIHALPDFTELQKLAKRQLTMLDRFTGAFQGEHVRQK